MYFIVTYRNVSKILVYGGNVQLSSLPVIQVSSSTELEPKVLPMLDTYSKKNS
jgi:hypothetical protein